MPAKRTSNPPAAGDLGSEPPLSAKLPSRVSLVDQTIRVIQQMIETQTWSDTLPGEEDLRAQLGISRVTLRKALTELIAQGWILLGGRGQRHHIADSMHQSRAVRSTIDGVVCLSPFTELSLSWTTRIIFDEIRKSLLARECPMEFLHRPSLWRGNPTKRLTQITTRPDVSGWILFRASPLIQRWFEKNRLPCVVLGPCHEGINLPAIEIDNAALGRHLAAEAARLGHHHIAYVVFDPSVASSLSTIQGLRELKPTDGTTGKVTVISDDTTLTGLRKSLHQVMAQPDPPTLVMVTQADQALPTMGILRELNLEIPRDVSLVVRDHEPFLDRCVPELTRYTFDWLRFGRNVAKTLDAIIKGGHQKPSRHVLLPVFIPGKSLIHRRPPEA